MRRPFDYERYNPKYYVLDEHGNPQVEKDLLTWAAWYETAERTLKLDVVGSLRISTIFLGLNHDFGNIFDNKPRPPVLWESMVFDDVKLKEGQRVTLANIREFGIGHELDMRRYTSREDAYLGHQEMVVEARVSFAKARKWLENAKSKKTAMKVSP